MTWLQKLQSNLACSSIKGSFLSSSVNRVERTVLAGRTSSSESEGISNVSKEELFGLLTFLVSPCRKERPRPVEQGWTEEHRPQVFANPGPQKTPALEPRPSKVWLRDVYLASFDRLEKS